jgi:uncharacterized Tic20 family protein
MEQQNQSGQPEQAQPVETPKPQLTNDDKNLGMLCHLLGLFTSFLGPLVLWLIKKDTMPFVDYHGKEALNFQITVAIAATVGALAATICIGFLILPIVWLGNIILSIIACIAASKGEYYKYPVCLRLVK